MALHTGTGQVVSLLTPRRARAARRALVQKRRGDGGGGGEEVHPEGPPEAPVSEERREGEQGPAEVPVFKPEAKPPVKGYAAPEEERRSRSPSPADCLKPPSAPVAAATPKAMRRSNSANAAGRGRRGTGSPTNCVGSLAHGAKVGKRPSTAPGGLQRGKSVGASP